VEEAITAWNGDIAAAVALNLPRKTFYDKLTRHQIDPNDYRLRFPVSIYGTDLRL
jgi:two-component system, NtrC family, C4-dicarboxylate transport response regulator DctD